LFLQSDKVNIHKPYFIQNNQIELRSLNGKEKRKLFENINELFELFPNIPQCETKELIWKDFFNTYFSIKSNSYTQDVVRKNTKVWLDLF
jgi:hypothetical protein